MKVASQVMIVRSQKKQRNLKLQNFAEHSLTLKTEMNSFYGNRTWNEIKTEEDELRSLVSVVYYLS